MNVFKIALCLCLIAPAGLAQAEWSSGGGKITKDAGNPWFIHNTDTVRYCIEADQGSIALSRTRLSELTTSAISYWKTFFDRWNAPRGSWDIRVGTQTFVEVACTPDTDLVLQFGVLHEDQREQLARPQDFVGIAVRTAYDLRQMKGKGFVYIAADAGELKPSIPGLSDGFWGDCDGCKLERVLIHELGHVFGMPHRGSSKEIMGEGYPEYVLSLPAGDYAFRSAPQRFLNEDGELDYEMCGMRPTCPPDSLGCGWWMPIRKYFRMPDSMQCLEVKGTRFGYEVYFRADRDATERHLAAKVDIVRSGTYGSQIDPLVRVYIPAEQTVVSSPRVRPNTYYDAVQKSNVIRAEGTMHFEDGSSDKSVRIDIATYQFEWLGIVQDEIKSILAGFVDQEI